MKLFRCITLALLSLILMPALAHADDLVQNGNFAAGGIDWTSRGWFFDAGTSVPNVGPNYAQTGCVGATCITGNTVEQAYLFQDLTTVTGDTYTLTFDFGTPGNPMELQVLFGGTVVDDLLNIGVSPMTTYTVTGLVASSPSTRLEFLGRQDPAYNALTNVAVATTGTGASPIPEPGSLVLLGTGLLGTFGVVRRRFVRS